MGINCRTFAEVSSAFDFLAKELRGYAPCCRCLSWPSASSRFLDGLYCPFDES